MRVRGKQTIDVEEGSDSDAGSHLGNPTSKTTLRGSSRGLFQQNNAVRLEPRQRPDFSKRNSKVSAALINYKKNDERTLLKDILTHHEFSLATNWCRITPSSAFTSACLALKDRILERLTDVQHFVFQENVKRAYFLSTEYLIGRLFQHTLLNLNIDVSTQEALKVVGVNMENSMQLEEDAGFGSAGLGRHCACMLDSFATLGLPVTAYGIRYRYGSYRQLVSEGQLFEMPDTRVYDTYPFEVERGDVQYQVGFGGSVLRDGNDITKASKWRPNFTAVAKAFDLPIPGFGTVNAVYLRQWSAIPDSHGDVHNCMDKDYYTLIKEKQEAMYLTWMMYPNPNTPQGIELKLKQEYFFVAASVKDIVANFLRNNKDWHLFPSKAAIQINDTPPALAIIELLRLLVDEHMVEFEMAWDIVRATFAFTNHSVLSNAVEKWDTEMLGRILPRHMELIYWVNHLWLESVKVATTVTDEQISDLSLVEEFPKKRIRMAALCILGSHTVNGVSAVHTQHLKTSLFKPFADLNPSKFINITNGCSVRRWVCDANPRLKEFLADQLGSCEFVCNYSLVSDLEERTKSQVFQKKWGKIKRKAKLRVVAWLDEQMDLEVSDEFMFDGMLKKVTETKRQVMFLLFVLYRYVTMKKLKPTQREKIVKRAFFLSGKPSLNDKPAKQVIEFGLELANIINKDQEMSKFIKLIYIPNYNVSVAEVLIPGMDLSEHISLVGTEASGTSNMKAAMNGAVIIGTYDGANLEISQQVRQGNIFLFGMKNDDVEPAKNKVG